MMIARNQSVRRAHEGLIRFDLDHGETLGPSKAGPDPGCFSLHGPEYWLLFDADAPGDSVVWLQGFNGRSGEIVAPGPTVREPLWFARID